ncbi:sorbin and SH3 domain-containing protein 1 isoform X10 [Nymphalis io]|uniref:sorbin and SH3 domain-containing protein 1 isoform X10 n=1 Tax=Inachis io TaxID=171585 RepID=UPI002166CA95|nr:sorbin and SH3 domain-containing protein 1 isoform X10 [Nymphalis io]
MKNPFESIDNFCDKYNSSDKINGTSSDQSKQLYYSKNDGDFRINEEVIKHSSVTEQKIKEIEEIKTIKKVTLNGSVGTEHNQINGVSNERSSLHNSTNEKIIPTTIQNEDLYRSKVEEDNISHGCIRTPTFQSPCEEYNVEDQSDEVLLSRPPVKSPSTSSQATTPTYKPIWRPGAPAGGVTPNAESPNAPPPPPPPVWSPSSNTTSPQTPRKTFRPVHFEDTPPPRRKFGSSDQNGCTSGSESEGRLRTSLSAPATGLNTLGSSSTSRLPRAQNPTVTLLQKAREGQISRGLSNYQQEKDPRLPRDRPSPPKGDPVHALRKEYASEAEGDRGDYERSQKMTDVKKKIEGIGPTTKDGMPVALRSEVKDPSRWYKKMYDTIHKNKYDEDCVTIRYKNRRGELQRPNSNRSQYAYFDPRSGYLSEPEGGLSRLASSTWSDAYDSDVTSGPRRRTASVQEDRRFDDVSSYVANNKYSTLASGRARQEVYKSQPGRIENYVPGKSSVIDKEAKQWWDEVMDIFDGQNESSTLSQSQASPKEKKDLTSAILSKSNMARALKESGYESDSTLIFRRREDTEAPLSPAERRAAYKDLQAGGEPPLRGFRSPAPPRQETDSAPEPPRRASHGSYSDSESPSRRYVESDVNIHYRCPVRHDPLPLVPERELARQQAEHMKRLYREQKRNKYLQENDIRAADIEAFDASIKELQDMQNRRHQDNFMPSQKTVVPLNRYDEAEKIIARALYTFNGQTARELSFRKGDVINVRKQIDSNWYEGEVHGKIGLFPYNYVELLKGDGVQTLKKSAVVEGRARAKFDFIAQTNLELPLKKGEVVVLTRRIDHNWWEGRNGSKTGIFPDSYVTILQEPTQGKPEPYPTLNTGKPVASPAAHGLLNGTDKRSMGAHRYTPQPNSPALANAPPATQPLAGYITKSSQSLSASDRGYGPPTGAGVDLNNTEPLYVDTNAEAIPYRAMYKYRPQNPDELELNEGDTVYVLEKCDDGWYVGSSQRTGRFGTFPGNYVERI